MRVDLYARSRFPVLCVMVAAFWSACSHYQLGTGAEGKLSFRTIYVAPVENKSHAPQIRELVTTQLREAFARDPRITLADSPTSADAILTVALTDYRRDIASAREDDTGLARKFNVTLTATATLRDNRSGKIFFDRRPVSAVREIFTDSGQIQSEYQVLPLLADALAAKLTHAALDVW